MAIDYKSELAKLINSMQSEKMNLEDIELTLHETICDLVDDILECEVKH
jgi:hypothetical protein